MQRGYIKIWRKLEDSGLLQMHGTLALFMFILLKAAHKPIKIGTPTGIVELERGQYMSGRHKLSAALLLSEREIRTCLSRLEKLDILRVESTSRYSIYTIVNYSNYQDSDQQIDQQATSKRPASDQQATTKQTLQELKALETLKQKPYAEYSADFELAWTAYPKRAGASKKDAYKAWGARLKSGTSASVMIEGAIRYSDYCKAQYIEQKYIKQASTFFGTGEHYMADWTVSQNNIATGTRRPQTVQESRLDCINQIMGNRHGHANKIIDISAIGSDSSDGASVPKIDGEIRQPDGDKVARLKHG